MISYFHFKISQSCIHKIIILLHVVGLRRRKG